MKHFTHHSHRLLQVKLAVIRHDSRCILPTVLEHNESIIEILDHVSVAGDSKDPAHIRVEVGKKRSSRPPECSGSRKETWRCYPRMHSNDQFCLCKLLGWLSRSPFAVLDRKSTRLNSSH